MEPRQAVSASAGSYAELDRTWSDGDVITLTLPMNLHLDRAIDDESQVSVFYGPVLLAGDLGTENLPDNHQEAVDQWDLSGYTDPSVPSLMASDAGDLTGWVSFNEHCVGLYCRCGTGRRNQSQRRGAETVL